MYSVKAPDFIGPNGPNDRESWCLLTNELFSTIKRSFASFSAIQENEAHSLKSEGRCMFTFASEETYEDGHVVIKEGTSGDWLYVVLSGSVEISKTIGGNTYVIDVLKPGEIFGEVGFLGGKKRTATVKTIGQTTLGVIDRTVLDAEFNELSSDLRNILMAMAKRFEKMVNRVIEFSSRSEARLQKTLSLTYKDNMAFVRAYLGNVSTGGVFIRTEKPLFEGEKFLLRMQLPELPDPLKISCEVVWARGPAQSTPKEPAGLGVKFIEMTKKDSELLKQYVNRVSGR
jgi:CRP/FNR family cyclic AMP-dependent transcriptional regulator